MTVVGSDLQGGEEEMRRPHPAGRVDFGTTTMLFGYVGHWYWHTPQPVQPSSMTWTLLSFSSSAADPRGQWSMQILQSVPWLRTHRFSRHSAVPMSISASGVTTKAPVGHAGMHRRPSHRTHGIVSTSMYGAPPPTARVSSSRMHWAGQTSAHLPHRLHVSRNFSSNSAPGGRTTGLGGCA